MEKLMKCPLISIIVPVYKVESFIEKCVCSIIEQTYTHIEIILVDDGSPDKCPKICDDFAKKDSRIKVVHQKNMGLPYARRSGYLVSKGDYIYFLDSDDYIDKDCIKILVSHAQVSNADITLSGINNVNISTNRIYVVPRLSPGFYDKQLIQTLLSKDYLFNQVSKVSSYPLYAWGKLIKRDVMDGYFDVSTQFHYWEDMPSTFYLIKKINSLEVVKENLYYYVIHPNQVTKKPIESIWHYYVDVWNYLAQTDTDGFLKNQLPQRMWWVVMSGLKTFINRESDFWAFRKLFSMVRDTPIVQRKIFDAHFYKALPLTHKVLHYLFKKKWSRLYYITVKYDLFKKINKLAFYKK